MLLSSLRSVASFGNGVKYLLFPAVCEGCRKPLVDTEFILCVHCELHLDCTNYHHMPQNETALRLSGRVPFVQATSLAYFTKDGLLQHLMHGLKYNGKKQTGNYLGMRMGTSLKEASWQIDAVVPVPLHRKKQALRGYNQSDEIARGIASVLQVPVVSDSLVRHRSTDTQTNKTREERIHNVMGAFSLWRPERISGKHVLLVDDVMTTGATLEACALSLLSAPGVSVSIATAGIAR